MGAAGHPDRAAAHEVLPLYGRQEPGSPLSRHHRVEARWEARAAVEADEAAPGADEELRYGEVAKAAARAIESLPERCRLVFTLSRQQHLTYAEIAQTLDISVSTVETQMWRALKILRAKLAPYLLLAIAIFR